MYSSPRAASREIWTRCDHVSGPLPAQPHTKDNILLAQQKEQINLVVIISSAALVKVHIPKTTTMFHNHTFGGFKCMAMVHHDNFGYAYKCAEPHMAGAAEMQRKYAKQYIGSEEIQTVPIWEETFI